MYIKICYCIMNRIEFIYCNIKLGVIIIMVMLEFCEISG